MLDDLLYLLFHIECVIMSENRLKKNKKINKINMPLGYSNGNLSFFFNARL